MQLARVRILVSGRVQGVAFRAYTREMADDLGLCGWVRNLPNGSVEVLAEGPPDKVDALVAWCRHGPPAASVDDVELFHEQPTGDTGGFWIRR